MARLIRYGNIGYNMEEKVNGTYLRVDEVRQAFARILDDDHSDVMIITVNDILKQLEDKK